MAWRIEKHLIRGEIDNRTPGRVIGRLWFLGREDEPVVLDLVGDAWRDVAGHVLRFTNPKPTPPEAGFFAGLASTQDGVVGDITASRKVKVPDYPVEEIMRRVRAGEEIPWHWGNCLYLEWHSEQNGQVVIDSVDYQIEIDADAAWVMSEAEEAAQQEANGLAVTAFMERLGGLTPVGENFGDDTDVAHLLADRTGEEDDDDHPTSPAEAIADAEQARMDLLIDRVQARLRRAMDAGEEPDIETIMSDERERLRRERGEIGPESLTQEQISGRSAWMDELNAAAEHAFAESVGGDGKGGAHADHPLVTLCIGLHRRIHGDCAARGWLTGVESGEHPLRELDTGVMIASGKLAGALNSLAGVDVWPPSPPYAGNILVRLKKAREHLRDALAGADAAAEHALAEPVWLAQISAELLRLLAAVQAMIGEIRAVLRHAGDGVGEADADDDVRS